MFSDKDLSTKIATVSKGTVILIIGIDYSKDEYNPVLIIRTAVGLVGYIKPKAINPVYKDGETIHFDIPLFDYHYSSAG